MFISRYFVYVFGKKRFDMFFRYSKVTLGLSDANKGNF